MLFFIYKFCKNILQFIMKSHITQRSFQNDKRLNKLIMEHKNVFYFNNISIKREIVYQIYLKYVFTLCYKLEMFRYNILSELRNMLLFIIAINQLLLNSIQTKIVW